MYAHGWFKVAFTKDLTQPLTAAAVGSTRLVLVRTVGGIRAFDADCPHRGAHLAYGGTLDGSWIVCPFHGYRVGLDGESRSDFVAHEYTTLDIGGMVFVRLSDAHDSGLSDWLEQLGTDHVFVPGFELAIRASPEAIVENAFDRRHFGGVHDIGTDAFEIQTLSSGAIAVTSALRVPAVGRFVPRAGERVVTLDFEAIVFSPCLAGVTVSGSTTYTIITGATPVPGGGCVVRLSLALPHDEWGEQPAPDAYAHVLARSRHGLEDDRQVWENLSQTSQQHLVAEDAPLERFYEFCRPFRPVAGSPRVHDG